MRALNLRSISLGILLASIAAVGCTSEVEGTGGTGGDESDLTARLPPANAAPLLDAEELAFVDALNAYRKAKGITNWDGATANAHLSIGLIKAARKHSKEMADLNAVDATHNDRGRGDQGALRAEAEQATEKRIGSEYAFPDCQDGETPCGPSWGEDCARRADIGSGAAAFDLLRTNNGDPNKPGFSRLAFPTGEETPANMRAAWFTDIGVARAKSSKGVWYWTVTYGTEGGAYEPMASLNDTAEHSLLLNGSFELPAKDEWDHDVIGKGTWSQPQGWPMQKWHVFGSTEVRADNAYFVDGAGAPAHGMRITDSAGGNRSASATQLVKAVPGVNYELTARARKIGAGTGEQTAYLDFTNKAYARIGLATVKAGSLPSWTGDAIRVSATAPANTAYVRIILFASGQSGNGSTYDWDDVRLRAW